MDDQNDHQSKAPTKRAGRSPGYPGIDLQTALKRADEMWQAHRHHPTDVDSIYVTWGYSKGSGAGNITFAALRKFGLIAVEGSGEGRRGRLSDLALDILRDERPNSVERQKAIRRAAFLPPIHAEVWERYGGNLPDDGALALYLERQRGFTPSGASDFIQQLRRTMAFAGAAGPASIPGNGSDNGAETGAQHMTPPPETGAGTLEKPLTPPAPGVRQVQLTIPGQESWGTFSAPMPLTEEQWALIMAQLEIHKQTWVQGPPSE